MRDPHPVDETLQALRRDLEAAADPEHAAFHRAYHKSELCFFGLRTPALRGLLRKHFPERRPRRADHESRVKALWASPWFEERVAALWLLERMRRELAPADLGWLHAISRDCAGWALTDQLATRLLAWLALEHGEPVYRELAGWLEDPWLWTRRAAILAHVLPAREGRLAGEWAWPAFESRLHERDFFIRKAIGWALREVSKHQPEEVAAFLERVGERASGLTRREAMRRLPGSLRRRLERG